MAIAGAIIAALPGGRLHLQHGPIDLVVGAKGERDACRAAFAALAARFATVLDELCEELPALRAKAGQAVHGAVARRMASAVLPHSARGFITPMAAIAGAVADEMLAAMTDGAGLRRAYVNNGGDIALYIAPGEAFRTGLMALGNSRPYATATLMAADGMGGIATSGWPGRSFSLGIADAVTICARTAAEADAAATVVANAVDLPGHPAVQRMAATSLQAESDLGGRLVTRGVGRLTPGEIGLALDRGAVVAARLLASGRIGAAVLHCQGVTRMCLPTGQRRILSCPDHEAAPREHADG